MTALIRESPNLVAAYFYRMIGWQGLANQAATAGNAPDQRRYLRHLLDDATHVETHAKDLEMKNHAETLRRQVEKML